tara:strand:+ start:926 stop:1072 length:147 start_codon:yes stop_codon:yes gene_type:complete
MIVWFVFWAIVPIAIIAAIFIPAFTPAPDAEDSKSIIKSEQVIKEDKD